MLGKAFADALPTKRGIKRFGHAFIPMDEALAFAAADISGRPFLVFSGEFPQERVGDFDTCMTEEFFRAFATNAGITLHLKCEYGKNSHHMIEALFKRRLTPCGMPRPRRRGMCCSPPRECCKALDGPAGVCYNKRSSSLQAARTGGLFAVYAKREGRKCMILLPAIDLHEGKCVRLFRGDYGTAEVVAPDPLTTALHFQEQGARWLHMVDLDGAKDGKPQNQQLIFDVVENTDLLVEVGGGIRDMGTVEYYLERGSAG